MMDEAMNRGTEDGRWSRDEAGRRKAHDLQFQERKMTSFVWDAENVECTNYRVNMGDDEKDTIVCDFWFKNCGFFT